MPIAQSSHLQQYDYDPDSQTLTVQFQDGTVYNYANVPQTEFWNLQKAGGSGVYFVNKIRNRFPTTKVYDPRV